MVFLQCITCPGDLLISMRIRNLKSEKVIRYMQCAQVMEGLFQ